MEGQNSPSQSDSRAESELHYKSLIELFKYIFTIATAVLTLIGIGVGYLTYNNGQEMRADLKEQRELLNNRLKEMKDEVKEEEKSMRDEVSLVRKNLIAKELEMRTSAEQLSAKINQEVNNARLDAVRQISGVRNEATRIAKSEAQTRIDQVFKQNNLEHYIDVAAKNTIEPRVNRIVDEQFGRFTNYTDKNNREMMLLDRLLSNSVNPNFARIDSLKRFATNRLVKEDAHNYMQSLGRTGHGTTENKFMLTQRYNGSKGLVDEFFRMAKPINIGLSDDQKIIDDIFQIVTDKNSPLSSEISVYGFMLMSTLLKKKVLYFDYKTLEEVYNEYKRKPYPLKIEGSTYYK